MNPIAINQLFLDQLSVAHGKCMETCLDNSIEFKTNYYIRSLVGREVNFSAREMNAWIDAKHTVHQPARYAIGRRRAVRDLKAQRKVYNRTGTGFSFVSDAMAKCIELGLDPQSV